MEELAGIQTVHFGGFAPDLKPTLTVNSGDTIAVETFSGLNIYDQAPPAFVPPEFLDIWQHLAPKRRIGGGPHFLTGPIWVEGAEPGDVLEVKLHLVTPRLPIGYKAIRPSWGALTDRFGEGHLRFIPLDLEHGTAEFPAGSGIKIPIRPFI